ncbi:DUF5392 family protein [Bacillus marinisedimentorum]|uniref:DUF5392 family protein n=1 Tax=Bacillus marinisedimentorum TaxID=1821260 RepID=UPI0014719BEA|nr:DUF5392 family protein [Bacillus marinisedimentorum]
MPQFVIKEIEKLEETLQPIKKKAARYSFWSFPLIAFSVFNLFVLLFAEPEFRISSIVLYALIGAAGMAISKEGRYQQKEMIKQSTDYMVERINKSDAVPHSIKEKYTDLVQSRPFKSVGYFVEFLEEENRSERVSYY